MKDNPCTSRASPPRVFCARVCASVGCLFWGLGGFSHIGPFSVLLPVLALMPVLMLVIVVVLVCVCVYASDGGCTLFQCCLFL